MNFCLFWNICYNCGILINSFIFILQLIFVSGLYGYELKQRILDSWSSYTSWSTWSSNSACIFLNNAWVSAITSTVSTDAYSPSTEGAYWSSSTSSGIIYMGSSDETYSLFQLAGASLSAHSTCRWIFSNSNLKNLKLTIQRSPSNYEDIYIQYNIDSQTYSLSTKDLTSWSSSTSSITLSNASSIIIKVKRLSSMSNYSIILSSQTNPILVFNVYSHTKTIKFIWFKITQTK